MHKSIVHTHTHTTQIYLTQINIYQHHSFWHHHHHSSSSSNRKSTQLLLLLLLLRRPFTNVGGRRTPHCIHVGWHGALWVPASSRPVSEIVVVGIWAFGVCRGRTNERVNESTEPDPEECGPRPRTDCRATMRTAGTWSINTSMYNTCDRHGRFMLHLQASS